MRSLYRVKLGNYYQKSIPVKRKQETSIVVTNEHIKKDFDKQIKVKEEEVKTLQAELEKTQEQVQTGLNVYRDLQKRHADILEEKREYEELSAQVFGLRTELGKAKQTASQVPDLDRQLKKVSIDKDRILQERSIFEKQGIDFKKQTIDLSNEYTALKNEYADLQKRLSVYEGNYPPVVKENTELKFQITDLQTQTEQQNDDINLLKENFFYWKDTASSLEDQLTNESTLRDELQRGLELLKKGNQLSSKKITKSGRAYREAQDEILTLNNRNLELTKFTDQMSKIIIEQKRKLASAGQLSQGQIGEREGLHIPFARENLRTKQLGNAKPTLLKFKETKNDNN